MLLYDEAALKSAKCCWYSTQLAWMCPVDGCTPCTSCSNLSCSARCGTVTTGTGNVLLAHCVCVCVWRQGSTPISERPFRDPAEIQHSSSPRSERFPHCRHPFCPATSASSHLIRFAHGYWKFCFLLLSAGVSRHCQDQ